MSSLYIKLLRLGLDPETDVASLLSLYDRHIFIHRYLYQETYRLAKVEARIPDDVYVELSSSDHLIRSLVESGHELEKVGLAVAADTVGNVARELAHGRG